MFSKCDQTFREILQAVGPENAQVLERKAHIAASIARICPAHQSKLHGIETQALDQAFRILACMGKGRVVRCTTGLDHESGAEARLAAG